MESKGGDYSPAADYHWFRQVMWTDEFLNTESFPL